MLTNYYTLRALIGEWKDRLTGAQLTACYSQHKGSLIFVFLDEKGNDWSLNASVQAPNRHLFLYSGSNRSKKNVVDLFPLLVGERIASVDIAHRDRGVTMGFENGSTVYFCIYGPRANVVFQHQPSSLLVPFRGSDASIPDYRPAPPEPSASLIEHQLKSGKPLKRLLPLFPPPLMDEVWFRAGGTEDPHMLASVINQLTDELNQPTGHVYWGNNRRPLVATIQLTHHQGEREVFDSVNEAVLIGARRRLALTRFSGRYDPLLSAIGARVLHAQKSLNRVVEELEKPSRAPAHEAKGHLIMAQPHRYVTGEASMSVEDWTDEGEIKHIEMDPKLSAIENAQAYYEKAKSSRIARKKAHERLQGLKKEASDFEKLQKEALLLSSIEEVETFQKKHAHLLSTIMSKAEDPDAIPYRRYVLDSGYEVWVGRNARQNDQLTMRDARKFDLWLHARGVAGSHTVLRLKGKTDSPPKRIVEQAASIAAFYSKARTSGLAPVIVVERKYVRKPRKALPGAVVVEREKVIMVEPGVPE